MTDPKEIKTVTAPVLVVEAGAPEPAPVPAFTPTVLDTQKIKKLILEAARLVTAEQSAKSETRVNIDTPKSPPYLLVILLMVVIGFVAIITLVILRPDLDFVIVAGVILPLVTVITTSIFNVMQKNQILQEAHEANIKAQLTLVQSRETHDVVNGSLTAFKKAFTEAEQERGKVLAAAALLQGRKEGRQDADDRTDKLSGALPANPTT